MLKLGFVWFNIRDSFLPPSHLLSPSLRQRLLPPCRPGGSTLRPPLVYTRAPLCKRDDSLLPVLLLLRADRASNSWDRALSLECCPSSDTHAAFVCCHLCFHLVNNWRIKVSGPLVCLRSQRQAGKLCICLKSFQMLTCPPSLQEDRVGLAPPPARKPQTRIHLSGQKTQRVKISPNTDFAFMINEWKQKKHLKKPMFCFLRQFYGLKL